MYIKPLQTRTSLPAKPKALKNRVESAEERKEKHKESEKKRSTDEERSLDITV